MLRPPADFLPCKLPHYTSASRNIGGLAREQRVTDQTAASDAIRKASHELDAINTSKFVSLLTFFLIKLHLLNQLELQLLLIRVYLFSKMLTFCIYYVLTQICVKTKIVVIDFIVTLH